MPCEDRIALDARHGNCHAEVIQAERQLVVLVDDFRQLIIFVDAEVVLDIPVSYTHLTLPTNREV